jgi:hypothetical protein
MRCSWLILGVVGAVVIACSGPIFGTVDGGGGDASPPPDGMVSFPDSGGSLSVVPVSEQDISVTCGTHSPTVQYTATVNAGWNVDQAQIGTTTPGPSTTTTFTPSGTAGGIVNVIATAGTEMVSSPVFVQLGCQQNGPTTDPSEQQQIATNVSQLTKGGGIGGVGGEGLGPSVDVATHNALTSPAGGNGGAQGL